MHNVGVAKMKFSKLDFLKNTVLIFILTKKILNRVYLFVCRCADNGVLTIYSRAMHSDLLGYEDHVLVITVQR